MTGKRPVIFVILQQDHLDLSYDDVPDGFLG
jgi:hypothetical protein